MRFGGVVVFAGLLSILGGLCPSAVAAPLRRVALPGDNTPIAGETVDDVRTAIALGGNRAAWVGKTFDSALNFLAIDNAGIDTLIVTQGDPAPGGGTFGTLGGLRGHDGIVGFQSQGVIYTWTAATGVRRVIGITDDLGAGLTLGNIYRYHVSSSGQVVVSNSTVVVAVDPDGTPHVIAAPNRTVPWAPAFTFSNGGQLISFGVTDDERIALGASGTDGTNIRNWVVIGTPTSFQIIEDSSVHEPDDAGAVDFIAVSREGRVAYTSQYTEDDTGPTMSHYFLKVATTNGSDTWITINTDSFQQAKFFVDGMEVGFAFQPQFCGLADPGMLVCSGSPMAFAIEGDTRIRIHSSETPGPAPGDDVPNSYYFGGLSANGKAMFYTSTQGTKSDVVTWSAAEGLQAIAGEGTQVGDVTFTSANAQNGIAADGDILVAGGYRGTGGDQAGAFLTRAGATTSADFELVSVSPKRTDFYFGDGHSSLGAETTFVIRNNGPDGDTFTVQFLVDGEAIRGIMAGDDDAALVCTVTACTFEVPINSGQSITLKVYLEIFNVSESVTVIVNPTAADDPDLANNERSERISFGDAGGCFSATGTTHGGVALVLALVLVRRRRRA